MRLVQNTQMQIGEVDVSQVKFSLKSRDDIPKILRGLQHLYTNEVLRKKVFDLLLAEISPKVSKANGRPGMTLWSILVCGVLRLDLNADYDRLLELLNQHKTLREMLGHGTLNENHEYIYQTVVDNVGLLTPELLDKLNQLIVKEGHCLLKKSDAALRGRCDSFVVETDVHFPTDISLLLDAMRKVIKLISQRCNAQDISDWRQSSYNIKQLKRLCRTVQNKKRSTSKSEIQKEKTNQQIIQAHQNYIDQAQLFLTKAQETLPKLTFDNQTLTAKKIEIEGFMNHAIHQIDQIKRRAIHGETIPHEEKVFSVFEPHTEWISKGKAGVPVELGLRVCILEDQHRFILHHHVMEKQTDDKVAVSMVAEAKKRFPLLNACSFDKGFHSPDNQIELKQYLTQVTLPKKGKLSAERSVEEKSVEFVAARRAHSAVESAINALEVHGLDICPDRGIDGFKRYVALAVVARNIHRIGDILWQRDVVRERKVNERKLKYRLAA